MRVHASPLRFHAAVPGMPTDTTWPMETVPEDHELRWLSEDTELSALSAFGDGEVLDMEYEARVQAVCCVPDLRTDGLWLLTSESKARFGHLVSPWLTQLRIQGNHCVDGEGYTLTLIEKEGKMELAGGTVTCDGLHLRRVGRTGIELTFARASS